MIGVNVPVQVLLVGVRLFGAAPLPRTRAERPLLLVTLRDGGPRCLARPRINEDDDSAGDESGGDNETAGGEGGVDDGRWSWFESNSRIDTSVSELLIRSESELARCWGGSYSSSSSEALKSPSLLFNS